jgi:hypothetical protein
MLVELHTMHDYYLASAGLQVTRSEILNQQTAKTRILPRHYSGQIPLGALRPPRLRIPSLSPRL